MFLPLPFRQPLSSSAYCFPEVASSLACCVRCLSLSLASFLLLLAVLIDQISLLLLLLICLHVAVVPCRPAQPDDIADLDGLQTKDDDSLPLDVNRKELVYLHCSSLLALGMIQHVPLLRFVACVRSLASDAPTRSFATVLFRLFVDNDNAEIVLGQTNMGAAARN